MALPHQFKPGPTQSVYYDDCFTAFHASHPYYIKDHRIAKNVWLMHIGSNRVAVKAFVVDSSDELYTVIGLRTEMSLTKKLGEGADKLGPTLFHLYCYDDSKQLISDLSVPDDTAYAIFIMERIDGTILSMWPLLRLKARGPLVAKLTHMIDKLHAMKYIHGDLHFGNVAYRLDANFYGHAKLVLMLIDWGRTITPETTIARRKAVLSSSPYVQAITESGSTWKSVTLGNMRAIEHWWVPTSLLHDPVVAPQLPLRYDESKLMRNYLPATYSAIFVYWLRQRTCWPAMAVFKGGMPVHYMLLLPSWPTAYLDESGVIGYDETVSIWRQSVRVPISPATGGESDKIIGDGVSNLSAGASDKWKPSDVSTAALQVGNVDIAKVDDVFSNINLVLFYMGKQTNTPTEISIASMRALATTVIETMLVKRLQCRDIYSAYAMDDVSRGFKIDNHVAHTTGVQACAVCFHPAPFKCGRCAAVYYCSDTCQRLAWQAHRDICTKN
jgi:hypothetical protein